MILKFTALIYRLAQKSVNDLVKYALKLYTLILLLTEFTKIVQNKIIRV
jgi:hypothetical protein